MMPAHMIWLVAFAAWPLPVAPKCVTVLPIAARMGCARSNASVCAAHHDGERGIARAFGAAAHGAIEEVRRAARAAVCAAWRAVSALTVEQSMTSAFGREAGRERVDDVEHVLVGGDAEDDGVGDAGERFGRIRRAECRARPRARAAFSGVRFQTPAEQPGAMEVARHVRSHRTETDESHAHRSALDRPRAAAGATIESPAAPRTRDCGYLPQAALRSFRSLAR